MPRRTLADPGAMPLERPTNFVLQKTDFMTKWPTPQVVHLDPAEVPRHPLNTWPPNSGPESVVATITVSCPLPDDLQKPHQALAA